MTLEKIREWLDTMIQVSCEINGPDYAEKLHTGGGCINVPPDIRRYLIDQKIVTCNDRGCHYIFVGKYGETVVNIVPNLRKSREYRKAAQNEERHKLMCLRVAKMMKQTDVERFEEMEPDLKTRYFRMPYSTLVRPLILSDYAAGVDCSQLARRYGVPYHTVYTWIKGK